MADAMLSINAGSSGIKFALFHLDQAGKANLVARGAAELFGSSPHVFVKDAAGAVLLERRWESPPDHEDLIEEVIGSKNTSAAASLPPWDIASFMAVPTTRLRSW